MSADRQDRLRRRVGAADVTVARSSSSSTEGDAGVTVRGMPGARPRSGDDHSGDAPLADPIGHTMPSFPGRPVRPSAHSAITVPGFDTDVRATSAEIAARVRARPPEFPLPHSDRYECVRFLGEGGMGKVFLARDLRLGREVAIKFVRGDNRDHTLRLLAEARAQAQVNHDRVCKVYEVDEVEGEVFIAMQYIDGEPLSALTKELTVEQKVLVMRDASEGVHAAHRVGIIHRDLNPNNIMVERDQDGRLRPYVMDFGLARDRKEGATETGTVMGTPHYMSPEQARGEVGRLDRRADVYSLGASLYVVLTGVQPIPGDNGLVVLNNIQLVEPRRLRAIDRDIPIDLEAIALKCLEKERSARYDSARALAEDLGRFLDGEAVLASRAGLGYRLRKRIRKHWRALAVTLVVATVLGLAVAWGVNARREVAERERLARRFTERVEAIEASARYSALSRLHDIRDDRAQLRLRMAELAADVARAGSIARGPGHYALGRGYLALGDRKQARRELEEAWQAGYREPRVAYALALVLGGEYRDQLAAVERIPDQEQREARKRVINAQYRDPAAAYLKQIRGALSTEYVAALLAFYEERYDNALERLDAISGQTAWFYEVPELRGDVLRARAIAASRVGGRERALADLEAGRQAYAAATATGESVPELHAAQAELEASAFEQGLYTEADVEAPFTRGVAATARALAAMPDHVAALVIEASLCRMMAVHRGTSGVAIDDLLQRALAAANRAALVDPNSSAAWLELSRTYWAWAEDRQRRNEDPVDQLRHAVAASDRVADDARDSTFLMARGLIFKVWADHQDSVGAPSEDNRGKAIEAYERALALAPRAVGSRINLAANYLNRATAPRATDPDGDLKAAAAALDAALAINPRHAAGHYFAGSVLEQIAQRAWARGGDPRPDLARALGHYRAGIESKRDLPYLHNGAGTILLDQATDTWDRGGDPEPLLAEARATFETAIEVAPDQVYAYNNLGVVLRRRAGFQRASGDDPTEAARAAAAVFEQALARSPNESSHLLNLGHTRYLLAAAALDLGRDPTPSLVAAEAVFAKALAQNPTDGDAHLGRASTLGVRAQLQARRGPGNDRDFEAAAAAFAHALTLAPEDQDAQLEAAHFDRVWAAWRVSARRDAQPALSRGLERVDLLLAQRPTWAAAQVLRGSLLVLQAQATTALDARRAAATRAVADFTAAFATNAHLQQVWRPQATRAAQLAASP